MIVGPAVNGYYPPPQGAICRDNEPDVESGWSDVSDGTLPATRGTGASTAVNNECRCKRQEDLEPTCLNDWASYSGRPGRLHDPRASCGGQDYPCLSSGRCVDDGGSNSQYANSDRCYLLYSGYNVDAKQCPPTPAVSLTWASSAPWTSAECTVSSTCRAESSWNGWDPTPGSRSDKFDCGGNTPIVYSSVCYDIVYANRFRGDGAHAYHGQHEVSHPFQPWFYCYSAGTCRANHVPFVSAKSYQGGSPSTWDRRCTDNDTGEHWDWLDQVYYSQRGAMCMPKQSCLEATKDSCDPN